MKKQFAIFRERTVVDKISFTKEQFIDIISSDKPTEIQNDEWSSRMPFIVITEYNENGIKYYCNGAADKTPEQKTIEQLYNFLRYQGLDDCYINAPLKMINLISLQ